MNLKCRNVSENGSKIRFGRMFAPFFMKMLFTNHNKWWICNKNTYVLTVSDNGGADNITHCSGNG